MATLRSTPCSSRVRTTPKHPFAAASEGLRMCLTIIILHKATCGGDPAGVTEVQSWERWVRSDGEGEDKGRCECEWTRLEASVDERSESETKGMPSEAARRGEVVLRVPAVGPGFRGDRAARGKEGKTDTVISESRMDYHGSPPGNFGATRTRTRQNPYPRSWVRVPARMGMGASG
ncbi:hypothetical protein EDB84DRAFT_1441641 [Lactarius hengduanensis]|nr:hypothetical protein EDB84DRAFT_1441641 [Lactarius hengduanensis]